MFSGTKGNLKYCTKLGGSSFDRGISVSVSQNNTILLMGFTNSEDFPVKNAYLDSFQGETDLFITHLYIEESSKIPGYSNFALITILYLIGLAILIKKKNRIWKRKEIEHSDKRFRKK